MRQDGGPLTLNVAIAPLRSSHEKQKGAIVVLENVTSRVKLEEGLQQNEKLSSIGLLAAGVAHEVNTPLTGVSSYTQMLLGMIPESDPKHELLQKVHKQTERATNIVGNLLLCLGELVSLTIVRADPLLLTRKVRQTCPGSLPHLSGGPGGVCRNMIWGYVPCGGQKLQKPLWKWGN